MQKQIEILKEKLNLSNSDEEKIELLKELSKLYLIADDYGNTIILLQKGYALAHHIEDEESLIFFLNSLGTAYIQSGKISNALNFFKKIYEKNEKDSLLYGIALSNLGGIYNLLGDCNESLKFHMKFLEEAKKENDKSKIAFALNNIGFVYEFLNDYDKALENFKKALELKEEIGNEELIASTANNVGRVYVEMGKHNIATDYLQKSLLISEQLNQKNVFANVLMSLGKIYKNEKDYRKALEYYLKSLKAYKDIGSKIGIVKVSNKIGRIYQKLEQLDKGVVFLENSLNLSKEIGSKSLEAKNLHDIAEIHAEKGDFEKAYEELKAYTKIKDSFWEEKRAEELAKNLAGIESEDIIEKFDYYKNEFPKLQSENEELSAKSGTLEYKNNFIHETLGIVVHNLRNPISAINWFSELTFKNYRNILGGTGREHLKIIQRNCKKMDDLLNDLLETIKLDNQNYQFPLKKLDLVDLLKKTKEIFTGLARDKKIDFRLELPRQKILVEANEEKLFEICENLISNSIKFTDDGGKISISLATDEDSVEIHFADTGVGIPENKIPFLFDKFTQAGRKGIKGENSVGLGMSIVKRFVELHNGQIQVESQENQGTNFYILLPLIKT